MFYVTLQQQLCGKHDVWHNFQDENYFQKNPCNFTTLAQLTKYSCNTTKQSTKAGTYNWQVFDEIEYTSWINSCM